MFTGVYEAWNRLVHSTDAANTGERSWGGSRNVTGYVATD